MWSDIIGYAQNRQFWGCKNRKERARSGVEPMSIFGRSRLAERDSGSEQILASQVTVPRYTRGNAKRTQAAAGWHEDTLRDSEFRPGTGRPVSRCEPVFNRACP